jgi:hypothetical protein
LYLLCGVAGGLVQVLSTVLLPQHVDIAVVGASAGVCGMIAIFCTLHPMQELTVFVYFFPVTIRARYLLWFLGGFSLFRTIIPLGAVAHGAHLGGILLGIGYVRWLHGTDRLSGWWARLRGPRRRTPIVKVRFPKAPGPAARPPRPEDLGATDFISKEVDPILEKISASGIHSLTEREREILRAARSKMDKG